MEWFTDVTKNAKGIEKKTTQTAFIPRVGLVYALTPSTNVYASWIRGFEPQSVAIQSDPETGGPFDPMKSELWEVGAKGEYLNKRLSVTTSVFRIRKNNSLYSAGDPVNPKLRVAVGEEVSRGVEFDVSGRILPYWSITANYSYNIAEITKAAPGTKDLNIQRPGTPQLGHGIGHQWCKCSRRPSGTSCSTRHLSRLQFAQSCALLQSERYAVATQLEQCTQQTVLHLWFRQIPLFPWCAKQHQPHGYLQILVAHLATILY